MELAVVLPIAELIGAQRFAGARGDVFAVVLLGFRWQRHVTRQEIGHQSQIGQSLDVRVAAQGIHAAAGNADITEQQLHHGAGADDLRTDRMLGPAECVQDSAGARWRRGGCQHLAHFQKFFLRRAAHALHHFRRIAIVVLFHQVEYAARMGQGWIGFYKTVVTQFVIPGGLGVVVFFRVVA